MREPKQLMLDSWFIFFVYSTVLLVLYTMIQGAGISINYDRLCLQQDSFVYNPATYDSILNFKASKN
jgi:hypothetical protein